jgi:VanZ family protein
VRSGKASFSLDKKWRAFRDRFGLVLVAANLLALMLASWTPSDYVVRSGVLSGRVEHAVVYALSGALMCALLAGRWAVLRIAVQLVAYAGVLELGQLLVPGRHAAIGDFCFSAAGALAGVLAYAALHRRLS